MSRVRIQEAASWRLDEIYRYTREHWGVEQRSGLTNSSKPPTLGKQEILNAEVAAMIAELRAKSQVTLPKVILEKVGLAVGDLLDITERDGGIFMLPVVVTPKKQESREEEKTTVRKPFPFGCMKGKIWMDEDFDAPLEDFREYME